MGDKLRPAGWYKSGKTLFIVWGTGTLTVSAFALVFLYPDHQELESYREKIASTRSFQKEHRAVLAQGAEDPVEPGPDELKELQKKVPPDADAARLLVSLTGAVDKSRAAWVELRTADRSEEMKPLDGGKVKGEKTVGTEEKEGTDELERHALPKPKNGTDEPYPPQDPHLKRYWADLYVQADADALAALLDELDQLDRTVTVHGWEYVDGKPATGNVRLRLAFYAYEDEALKKDLPAREALNTDGAREFGESVQPDEEEKEVEETQRRDE